MKIQFAKIRPLASKLEEREMMDIRILMEGFAFFNI